ncbi:alpha/beta-Hydrolases superfamily protein [Striga asiatica]|uniref:Alpha/beta-Hydrolases superfamily protein n=2 Tax=Striga asiatica TaxID=4170 RepID=A0A5A7P0U2_STRAF|nr:alpha/beta-Hydrolases superfamily protein [Striga asiatica]
MAATLQCCVPKTHHKMMNTYCSTITAEPAKPILHKSINYPLLSKTSSLSSAYHNYLQAPQAQAVPKPKLDNIASGWREIQGLNNWENLVSPLHPLLRDEIIRYGELVKASYEAFDLDPNSKRYLNCKHGKHSLLQQVGLGDSGYEVTKYIYATAPPMSTTTQSGPSRWVGYVAASDDESVSRLGRRDIVIAFRGTVTNAEWIANLNTSLTPARLNPHDPRPDVKVEAGFLSLYTTSDENKFGLTSCREQLLAEVSRLLNKHKDEEISITLAGHSMGSSLALLLAYDIAELGLNRPFKAPITVFSFGGPRVGNSRFKERCQELGVKVLRVVNAKDPVTKLPGIFFNNDMMNFNQLPWSCSCYAHVGVELVLDFFKMQNPSCVHDLANYIKSLSCPSPSPKKNLSKKSTRFVEGPCSQLTNAATNMLNMVHAQWA